MVIDIVTFTDAQYAAMSEGQLLEVRNAQMRANALRAEAKRLEREVKFRMIENGVGRSTSREAYVKRELARIDEEIETVRQDLLFYLRFVMKIPEGEEQSPYPLDYSLTYEQRVLVVRDYYLETYTDARERFEGFKADGNAKRYLGEEYASMYAYFKLLAGE